jgi:septal ring factor EnvC (AmiA/AmiB activator)
MEAIIFNAPNSQSSKADEIAFLREVSESIGEGTYLKSLFTEDLLKWVESCIADDVSCNIRESFTYQVKQAYKVENNLRERIDSLEATIDSQRESVKQCARRLDDMTRKYNETRAMLDKAHEDLEYLNHELQESDKESYRAIAESNRLKVKLADITARLAKMGILADFADLLSD